MFLTINPDTVRVAKLPVLQLLYSSAFFKFPLLYLVRVKMADTRYSQALGGGMRTVYLRDLNEGLSSKLPEGYRVRQIAYEEDR